MSDYERYIDDEWDRAEAEMLEQVSLITGQPTVRLPGLFTNEQAAPKQDGEEPEAAKGTVI